MLRSSYRCHGCNAPLRISSGAVANRASVRCGSCGRDVDWEQYSHPLPARWGTAAPYPNPYDHTHDKPEPSAREAATQSTPAPEAQATPSMLAVTMLLVVATGLATLAVWLVMRWHAARESAPPLFELCHPRATVAGRLLLELHLEYECPRGRPPAQDRLFVVLGSPHQRYEAQIPSLRIAERGTLIVHIPVRPGDRGPFSACIESEAREMRNGAARARASNTVEVTPTDRPRQLLDPFNLPNGRPFRQLPVDPAPWHRRPICVRCPGGLHDQRQATYEPLAGIPGRPQTAGESRAQPSHAVS